MNIKILWLLLCLPCWVNAQEILGTITDNKKEPLTNAQVIVKQGGVTKAAVITDFDGKYSVKPLAPGLYDVVASYTGFNTKTVTGVVVDSNKKTIVNFTLSSELLLREVVVRYSRPIVDPYKSATTLTAAEIKTKPTSQTTDLLALSPGVYQSRGGNQLIIDGAKVYEPYRNDMAQGSVEQRKANKKAERKARREQAKFFALSEESYKKVAENDFLMVKSSPLSTMSVDVDRASYANIRRFINDGMLPPADAVRIEEMVNYFTYAYLTPANDCPIAINTEVTTCPWKPSHQLLRVGIQARNTNTDTLPPSNLCFLIDVSGSMWSEERLPLIKTALKLLVDKLRPTDRVAIVVYAGRAGLALPATTGDKKLLIKNAIDGLLAGGSTAGAAGIELAYKTAADNYIKGGNNRVILATDGDFNVGVNSDNELEDLITQKRKSGIFLSCLGVGTDNFKDAKMEMLADKGNGNYNYLDNIKEAEKVLIKEFGGTLFTVAKDVKAQIEFNPLQVAAYRLIGYENRMLKNEDFKDDKKDAGDMGAGHTVTLLYELVPNGIANDEARPVDSLRYQASKLTSGHNNEIATIKFRYKTPEGSISKETQHTITNSVVTFQAATENTRFAAAVALFGMLLKNSAYKGVGTSKDVVSIATAAKGADTENYRAEFIAMVQDSDKIPKGTVVK